LAKFLAAKLYVQETKCPTNSLAAYHEARNGARYFIDQLKGLEKKPCPDGESGDSCNMAKDVLRSWQTDFRWTDAQHNVGARFALQNCKVKKPEAKSSNGKESAAACPVLHPANTGSMPGEAKVRLIDTKPSNSSR
jgi:hypothetical protein